MAASHSYYSLGKLLLTGEYFVCDGAKALALPTNIGQKMEVQYRPSYSPLLHWISYNREGKIWFEAKFEFWHFDILETTSEEKANILKKIFQQVRKQNSHFLRDDTLVIVKTYLEFPIDWGLGSSSTLIYNIAQWAYVGPFELQLKTIGGSGYDIACAQSVVPIIYHRTDDGPYWMPVCFSPPFVERLFFIYLGNKQNSLSGIQHYREIVSKMERGLFQEIQDKISKITLAILETQDLKEFERLILMHENLISEHLLLPKVKNIFFADYWGEVKSLGAWGGDFVLATSDRSPKETQRYFYEKGYDIFIPFSELIKMGNHHIDGGPSL